MQQGGNELVQVEVDYTIDKNSKRETVLSNWDELFYAVAKDLLSPLKWEDVFYALNRYLLDRLRKQSSYVTPQREKTPGKAEEHVYIKAPDTTQVPLQFLALDLVQRSFIELPPSESRLGLSLGGARTLWMLSAKGERKYLERAVIPSEHNVNSPTK